MPPAQSTNVNGIDTSMPPDIQLEKCAIQDLSPLAARAFLDERVHAFECSILALKALRNTLSPIRCLPDEILVGIFLLLVQDVYRSASARRCISWLTVTKVCHQWRSIALGTPKLWSFIDTRHLEVTREFLRRSAPSAPLDIFIDNSGSSDQFYKVLKAIQPDVNRMRKFECSIRQSSVKGISYRLGPAPLLEVLCLRQASGRRFIPSEQSLVLSNLFSGYTPAIRQIYLDHITLVPWSLQMYSALTHLELYFQHPDDAPSLDVFLDILKASPGLEELSLVMAGPTLAIGTRSYSPPMKRVELQHLRHLTLSNRPTDTSRMLAHLCIPSTTTIDISCDLEDADHDLSAVLPIDCSSLGPFNATRCFKFYVEETSCISIQGRFAHDEGPSLNINMSARETFALVPRLFLANLEPYIPLNNIQWFEATNCSPYITQDQWRDYLGRLPVLHGLIVDETSDLVHHQALITALYSPPIDEDGVVCPILKVLQIHGLDMSREIEENIATCCEMRKLGGAPLERLRIPGLNPRSVSILREIVPVVEVEWEPT